MIKEYDLDCNGHEKNTARIKHNFNVRSPVQPLSLYIYIYIIYILTLDVLMCVFLKSRVIFCFPDTIPFIYIFSMLITDAPIYVLSATAW